MKKVEVKVLLFEKDKSIEPLIEKIKKDFQGQKEQVYINVLKYFSFNGKLWCNNRKEKEFVKEIRVPSYLILCRTDDGRNFVNKEWNKNPIKIVTEKGEKSVLDCRLYFNNGELYHYWEEFRTETDKDEKNELVSLCGAFNFWIQQLVNKEVLSTTTA